MNSPNQDRGNISLILLSLIGIGTLAVMFFALSTTKTTKEETVDNKYMERNSTTTETKPIKLSEVNMDTNQWIKFKTDYLYDREYDAEWNKTEIIRKITFIYPAELYIKDFGTGNGAIWIRTAPNEYGSLPITMEISKGRMKGGIGTRTHTVEMLPFNSDVYSITKMSTESAIAYFINYDEETLNRDMGFQVTFWEEGLSEEEKEAAENIMDEIVRSFRFID